MNVRKFLKNTMLVIVSNYISLVASIVLSLVLPKIMTVSDYGWYKIFNLYTNYIGFLQFGFVDGIYLIYSGVEYNKLPRAEFRFYSKTLLMSQVVLSALVLTAAMFLPGQYKFVFMFLAIYIVIGNCGCFFKCIAQVVQQFRLLSIRNTIASVLTLIVVLCFLFAVHSKRMDSLPYAYYLVAFLLIEATMATFYLYNYHDICFGASPGDFDKKALVKKLIVTGFPLTIANIVAGLILTLDRQFVSILFDTKIYAYFSFAYSLITVITTIVSAVSMVLFPMMRQESSDKMISNYDRFIAYINLVVGFFLLAYVPICKFIGFYLPQYISSLATFRVILPGIAISSMIDLVIHNTYKLMNREREYFKRILFVLAFAALSNTIAYYIFRTPQSISGASIVTMLFWYYLTETRLVKLYHVKTARSRIYILLILVSYYLSAYLLKSWATMGLYFALYLVLSLLIYRKNITQVLTILRAHLHKQKVVSDVG